MYEKTIEPVAIMHTGFGEKFGIPRQSGLVPEAAGQIIFEPKYQNPDALRGIEEFTHLWIIWGFSEKQGGEIHTACHTTQAWRPGKERCFCHTFAVSPKRHGTILCKA